MVLVCSPYVKVAFLQQVKIVNVLSICMQDNLVTDWSHVQDELCLSPSVCWDMLQSPASLLPMMSLNFFLLWAGLEDCTQSIWVV